MIDWNKCPICDKKLETTSIGFCTGKDCPEGHYKIRGFHYNTDEYIGDHIFEYDDFGIDHEEERTALIDDVRKKYFREVIWGTK